MTSTLSQNKKSVIMTRVYQNIKESTALAIGICIIMLFSSVVNIMNFASYARIRVNESVLAENPNYVPFDHEELAMTVIGSSGISFVCMILAALIAIKCFRHMHKKSLVDLEYSLPLTTNQRFLASAVSTLVLIIGATIISALLTHIIAFSMLGNSTEFGVMFKKIGGDFSDVAELFVKSHLLTLSEMLLLVATGVLALSCCGILFDAIVYAGGSSVLIILIAMLALSIKQIDYSAFVQTGWNENWVAYISPFYSMLTSYLSFVHVGDTVDLSPINSLCIFRFVLSLALFAVAFVIHRKRRAEDVGKPFAFKPYYYVVSTLLILLSCGAMYINQVQSEFYGYDDYNAKGTIIMSSMIMFFAFLVLEVLAERKSVFSKKRVIQGIVRFAVTVPLCFAVAIIYRNISMGIMPNLPEADEVSTVSINCHVYGSEVDYDFEGMPLYDATKLGINSELANSDRLNEMLDFGQKEQIEDVLDLAEQINEFELDYYKKHKEYYMFGYEEYPDLAMMVYIEFYTRDGGYVSYTVDLSQDFTKQWVEKYLTDDELYGEYDIWY